MALTIRDLAPAPQELRSPAKTGRFAPIALARTQRVRRSIVSQSHGGVRLVGRECGVGSARRAIARQAMAA